MTLDESVGDREAMASWVRAADPGSLLPPRRRDAGDPPLVTALLDVLALPGGSALAILAASGDVLAVPLATRRGVPARAGEGDGVFEGLLGAMRAGADLGRFAARTFDEGSDAEPVRGERAIEADQSNESVVVGEQVVVKLYPQTPAGPQPGLELPAHLVAAGFTELPRPIGALTWRDDGGGEVLLATAVAYLPGARDGWDWYRERLLAWLDGDTDEDRAFGPAPVLGELAARMHVALAGASPWIPDPVGVADRAVIDGWRDRALVTLAEAVALTHGAEGERLRARAESVREALAVFDDVAEAPLTRVHGDIHVGQILRWDDGYAVTDFDGNPLAPVAIRCAFDTPVRDVAALVRSVDHLGRLAQARRPGRGADVERWIVRTRDVLLDAYWSELATHGHAPLFDGRLLRPLEVAQALHEYGYAARFLPRWLGIADRAMCALVSVPGER
jgi:maltokinase